MTGSQWHPARLVCPCVGLVLCCAGLLFGRVGVTLLGIPLVLFGLWPAPAPRMRLHLGDDADAVVIDQSEGVAAIRLRLSCAGHRPSEILVPGRPQVVDVGLKSVRTGPQPLLILDYDVHGTLLGCANHAATITSSPRVVLPSYMALGLVPESHQLRGLTGPMASRRAGDGFELRDVHPMGPSDSTRRIDWRVTARQPSGDIYVKGAYATGEPVSVLIVDSRDEVGSDLHTWSAAVPLRVDEPTSLDLARHAAASVARRLIESGDRVGLVDLATSRRLLAPAASVRHLNRLAYALALSAPAGPPRSRVRAPQVPAGAIVYLFTTLLDDGPLGLVQALRDAGHEVLVIDVLPVVRPAPEVSLELAWGIMSAERDIRIRRLAAQHVPLIPWAGKARETASSRLATVRRTWQGVRR